MRMCIPRVESYLPVHPHSFIRKQVRMTSKYHNHRPQTHPQHYVEEAKNNSCHTTARAQVELSRSIFFSQMIAKVDSALQNKDLILCLRFFNSRQRHYQTGHTGSFLVASFGMAIVACFFISVSCLTCFCIFIYPPYNHCHDAYRVSIKCACS